MKLEISESTLLSLLKDTLIQDYNFTLESIKELEAVKMVNGKLEYYQQADYDSYKKRRKAFKVLMVYYLLPEELDGLEGF